MRPDPTAQHRPLVLGYLVTPHGVCLAYMGGVTCDVIRDGGDRTIYWPNRDAALVARDAAMDAVTITQGA